MSYNVTISKPFYDYLMGNYPFEFEHISENYEKAFKLLTVTFWRVSSVIKDFIHRAHNNYLDVDKGKGDRLLIDEIE